MKQFNDPKFAIIEIDKKKTIELPVQECPKVKHGSTMMGVRVYVRRLIERRFEYQKKKIVEESSKGYATVMGNRIRCSNESFSYPIYRVMHDYLYEGRQFDAVIATECIMELHERGDIYVHFTTSKNVLILLLYMLRTNKYDMINK